LLRHAEREARGNGSKLRIVDPSPAIAHVITLCDAGSLLAVE
jgi:anti-anti-sigma regulatory factor